MERLNENDEDFITINWWRSLAINKDLLMPKIDKKCLFGVVRRSILGDPSLYN